MVGVCIFWCKQCNGRNNGNVFGSCVCDTVWSNLSFSHFSAEELSTMGDATLQLHDQLVCELGCYDCKCQHARVRYMVQFDLSKLLGLLGLTCLLIAAASLH